MAHSESLRITYLADSKPEGPGVWPSHQILRMPPVGVVAHRFWMAQAAARVGFAQGLTGAQSVRWRCFERVPTAASVSST